MTIRPAREQDIPAVLELLTQVLDIHAKLRPDIFIPGKTKYTASELAERFRCDETPVFVAVDESETVLGYAFCILEKPASQNVKPFSTLYLDDLCVDAAARGQGVGEALFRFVVEEAKRRGCYDVTLHVWEGNDGARRFYEKMKMQVKETTMEYIVG